MTEIDYWFEKAKYHPGGKSILNEYFSANCVNESIIWVEEQQRTGRQIQPTSCTTRYSLNWMNDIDKDAVKDDRLAMSVRLYWILDMQPPPYGQAPTSDEIWENGTVGADSQLTFLNQSNKGRFKILAVKHHIFQGHSPAVNVQSGQTEHLQYEYYADGEVSLNLPKHLVFKSNPAGYSWNVSIWVKLSQGITAPTESFLVETYSELKYLDF